VQGTLTLDSRYAGRRQRALMSVCHGRYMMSLDS